MIRCQNFIVTVNDISVHRQLQAPTQAFIRLIWEVFQNLVDRSLWQVTPENLKHFPDIGDCFRLCFKLAVSLQHCIPHEIVHWVYIRQIWRPLVFCDEIWTVGLQPVPCTVRCACWCAVLLDEPNWQLMIALNKKFEQTSQCQKWQEIWANAHETHESL